MLKLKRIYEAAEDTDGYRILADRLWPRGVSKEEAQIDAWNKDITPSNELRKEYHSQAIDFAEFSMEYRAELEKNAQALEACREIAQKAKDETVTLLTATKDIATSHLVILKDYIENA
ncbi:DUF488 domain-containing protein [Fundicoccus culcitae]|uniref:DUF488 family protein n=1 Tax=Fundicoccus culcitae TaxID=2969821 RepID=A0ABY5P874_9LACT|nr:DUF488 family protein [Fundicoccus culcitae]UUX34944.1 DUF488 family protein [Fundicoccus culcitae]